MSRKRETTTQTRHFRRLPHPHHTRRGRTEPTRVDDLMALLRDDVLTRFWRITGLTAVRVSLPPSGSEREGREAFRFTHPICRGCFAARACRETWWAHLAELRRYNEPHWHRCKSGNRRGFVPVTAKGGCMLLCQLVCDGVLPLTEFRHKLELLAILVENFTARHAGELEGSSGIKERPAEANGTRLPGDCYDPAAHALHPRVRQAIEVLDRHAGDPDLTVAVIARKVGMNSTYLAHLFCKQVGLRMSRYLAERRIELAKHLLATTDRQIKRVAYESGHHNADWFSHVFRAHTGSTPGQYRRRKRGDQTPRT